MKGAGFHFWKCKKSFLLRNYKIFFNLIDRKLSFLKHKEFFGDDFFYSLSLGWKVQDVVEYIDTLIIFSFASCRNKLEEVDFVGKTFLHKKIKKKDLCIWIVVSYRRYSRRCMQLRQYGGVTALNWSRWLKYYSFFVVKPAG